MRCVARRRPWAGVAWWKTSRTCPVKVSDFDTDMRLICREGLSESFLLTWGELVARGVQKKPDLVEGITLASAVTQGVLLDATAYFIKGATGERDDMEGIEDAGGVLELVINGVLISLEGIQSRDLHPCTEVFSALGQPVLVHGARPSRDQVHSSGLWDDPPRVSGPRCR